MTIYNLVIKTLQVKADQGREIGCQQGVSEAETLIQASHSMISSNSRSDSRLSNSAPCRSSLVLE